MLSRVTLEQVFQDVRFACRLMAKERVYSATAVAALALGIGANAAGFTIVHAALLRASLSQANAPSESPGDSEFYLKRGETLSSARKYDRAIADYTTAIQLRPDYAEAYNDRGFAYYLKGDGARAIADFTRAIELRPNYPKAYNSRGVAYMSHGYGAAKSVPDFDRAIELKPDFRYAYINRANARLLSHPRLALQDFHRAGIYPERTVAKFGAAIFIGIIGIGWTWRRRRARTKRARLSHDAVN